MSPQAWTKLNRFQRMMLAWDRLHPYNAAHLLHLRGPLDLQTLRQAVCDACETAGVGRFTLDEPNHAYAYLPTADASVEYFAGHGPIQLTAVDLVGEALNDPFPAEPHHPIRWIVVTGPDDTTYCLVALYHHVASDAYGVQRLLASVLARLENTRATAGPPSGPGPLRTTVPDHRRLFKRQRRLSHVARTLVGAARRYFQLRHGHRLRGAKKADSRTETIAVDAPRGLITSLHEVCRADGIGPNDAFLAALVVALAESTPHRRSHRRRKKIAVATITNTRKWATQDVSECFGVFLGHSTVVIDNPDGSFERVLQEVTRQTRLQKARREAAGPGWPFIFVRALWPVLRLPNTQKSYTKVFPICAGLSSFNVDRSLFESPAGALFGYARACPPGPSVPMVLAPTILGDAMRVTLTYRRTCLHQPQATTLVDRFIHLVMIYAAHTTSQATEVAPEARCAPPFALDVQGVCE